MPTKSEVEATILDLLQKAEKLRKTAESLAEVYGISLAEICKNASSIPRNHDPDLTGDSLTRKEMLRKFLKENGPQTRKAILEKTKLPIGTVTSLLTRHGRKAGEMKWDWADEKEENPMNST